MMYRKIGREKEIQRKLRGQKERMKEREERGC